MPREPVLHVLSIYQVLDSWQPGSLSLMRHQKLTCTVQATHAPQAYVIVSLSSRHVCGEVCCRSGVPPGLENSPLI